MSVSEWYVLKTGLSKNEDFLINDSGIHAFDAEEILTPKILAIDSISRILTVSSREIPTESP